MSQLPVITAIIPTYRRPKLLGRAIRSVLRQSYPHLKVCVYDNASGDETESIVRKIMHEDDRVFYYRHEKNIGLCANFQFGRDQVTTPYFSFLSDDDVLLPHCYEVAMQGFEQVPEAAFCGSRTLLLMPWGKPVALMPAAVKGQQLSRAPEGAYRLVKGDLSPIIWTSVVFRHEATCHVPAFIQGDELAVLDVAFLLQLAMHYPYVLSEVVSALYVLHDMQDKEMMYLRILGWLKTYDYFLVNFHQSKTEKKVLRLFRTQLVKVLKKFSWRALSEGNFSRAEELSALLSQRLNAASSQAILQKFIAYSQKFSWLQHGLRFFQDKREYFSVSSIKTFEEKYEEYARYLKRF